MRRYAVVLVIAVWGVAVALGLDDSPVLWLALLVPAVVVQADAHAKAYRHPHRRRW